MVKNIRPVMRARQIKELRERHSNMKDDYIKLKQSQNKVQESRKRHRGSVMQNPGNLGMGDTMVHQLN
jgi:hypothetical protein